MSSSPSSAANGHTIAMGPGASHPHATIDLSAPVGASSAGHIARPFTAHHGHHGLHSLAHRSSARTSNDSVMVGLMRRVMDELDYGIIIVDAQGEVNYVNRTARSDHVSAGLSGLTAGERLSAVSDDETLELLRAVRDAATLSRRSLVRLGTGMRQCIAVLPLNEPTETIGPVDGQALLLFGRRKVCEPLSIAFFARTFGLTPAETQVLEALCQGEPPTRIAARNFVALSTVRTQLTAIRLKTQTGSLRELVRQVSTLPPIVGLSIGDATH